MRIGMFGTFDVENYGDLLFPIIAERELKRRLEKFELVRYSYNEKDQASWYYSVRSLADLQKTSTGIQTLDCILIGGGHLIRFDKNVASNYTPPVEQIPHPTGYWLSPALAGITAGLPVIWNAPSASDEFPSWSHGLLNFVLKKSAYVSVRDQLSLESLQKIGYRGDGKVVPDTVFSLANHFPRVDLKTRTEELRSIIGLKKKYIIIQASPRLGPITRELFADNDTLSEYDILVLPIGPILWDDPVHITKLLPRAKSHQWWPSPEEIAGLVAYSSGVLALSLHLSITALVYGLPVLRPKNTQINKYDLLKSSENVYFYDSDNLNQIVVSFEKAVRSGAGKCCSLVKEAQSKHEEHWNTIAEICKKHERGTSSLVNHFAKANLLLNRREKLGDSVHAESRPQDTNRSSLETLEDRLSENNQLIKRSETCVILHLYYPDMWNKILTYLSNLGSEIDLYVTVPEDASIFEYQIQKSFPNARIYRCKNRGRDIAPFLKIYFFVATLGYKYICKVHTKKSPQYDNGETWNWDMWGKLLGSPEVIADIRNAFEENPRLGIIAPSGHLLPLMPGSRYWGGNRKTLEELAFLCGVYSVNDLFLFSAGSMFWFRPEVFHTILELGIILDDFEPESGQLDGTLAHALERFFGLIAVHEDYELAESDSRGVKLSEVSYHQVQLLKDFNSLEETKDRLSLQVMELTAQISEQTSQKSNRQDELSEIYRSKAWQFVQVLRRTRLLLVPVGSTREHIAQKTLQAIRLLRSGNHRILF